MMAGKTSSSLHYCTDERRYQLTPLCIITWAGRYCLVKGGWHILYDQGSIRQNISPAGRHTIKYRPCRAAYDKISALPCNNVNMPPLPSGTGKYTTHGPHYAALGLHYLPIGLQYCPRASGPLAVLEALGQIMQPLGSIMCP